MRRAGLGIGLALDRDVGAHAPGREVGDGGVGPGFRRDRVVEAATLLLGPRSRLPAMMIDLLHDLRQDLSYLDRRIKEIEATMKALNRQSAACRRLMTIPGIGELNASAFVAAIGRGEQFRCGRDLACWLAVHRYALPEAIARRRWDKGKTRTGLNAVFRTDNVESFSHIYWVGGP